MYIMKKETQLLILAIILFVLILITSVYSCCSFEPYTSTSLFSSEHKYESFTDKKEDLVGGDDTQKDAFKVEGFEGLQPSLYNAEKEIDSFSKTKGSPDCVGISSGLHNSLGGLCLNDEQKKSLSTRGGNSTSGESKIGAE